ncbi:MAG: endonuclease/exonuclease/phosphatase family protein [Phycisphaerales bacterium]
MSFFACFVLALALQSPAAAPRAVPPNVVHRLDGKFDDWATLDPVATRRDKLGDARGVPDIITASLASDDRSVWLMLEFAQQATLQGLDKPLVLLFDADGDPKTGAQTGRFVGADLVVVCSPDPADVPASSGAKGPPAAKDHGEGVLARRMNQDGSLGEIVPLEALGLGIAPSHASRQFEFRFQRSPQWFDGRSCGVLIAFREALPDGSVQWPDEVDPVRGLLPPRASSEPAKAPATSIARADGATLRVASWNAELGAIFKNPEPFGATLKAIAPDVVLFQELGAKATADELASWMNTNVGGDWHALVSGGDLRVGIVARRPLVNAPFLDGVQRKTPKGDRPVRVIGGLLDVDGQQLLLTSLHLKCCGRFESSEDETRLSEAETIHDAIRSACAKQPVAGIVVAGDFNLVGTPSVLDRTAAGLDLDGSELDRVDAYQIDGMNNATWRSTGDRFVPGRLDWGFVSGASIDVLKSFVFSAEDLAQDAVAALSLPASALKEPSDHQPLVMDLKLKVAPKPPIAPAAATTKESPKP